MEIKLNRYWQDENQTSGVCTVIDDDGFPLFSSLSLERGWRNNENNVSCVPVGEYDLVFEYSSRFKMKLWELKGVPGRSEAKFHASNYWYQLEGCIALGLRYKNLNSDNYRDLTNSADTLSAFHVALKDYNRVKLYITAEPNIK
jgi:hypothetical protein